ncbi:MAG: hypothetical protein RBT61_10450 [Candidatus Kapabacteria bacterium]|nr:hypothetical protein [Candidatus Kapabacteria bacterium]
MKTKDLYTPPEYISGARKNPSNSEGVRLMLDNSTKAMLKYFVAILFFVMLPLSTFSQDGCITTPPGAIDCGEWVNHDEVFNLSLYGEEYGDCEITAYYSSRVCTVVNGNCTTRVEQFTLGSIDWNWTDDEEDPC